MAMLPIFILGLILGATATIIVINTSKGMPSSIRLATLEDTIESLNQDLDILENENKELKEKLKKIKAAPRKTTAIKSTARTKKETK